MRAFVVAFALLAGCTDGPSVQIIAPLPDSTVVATVELRMKGHELGDTTETKVFVDREHYTGELIDNTLPSDCDDCMFTISFNGPSIPNGTHAIGVYFYDGDKQLATDAISLVFAR